MFTKNLIVFFYFLLLPIHNCWAEITTDGTVGSALTLNGPDFQIDQFLGTLKGNNLFHSFGKFNITRQESATFTGSDNIHNIFSRVTGGQASTIDGLLKSDVGQANFYFINPAGIIFGANAQIDVPAAFYASTATKLNFTDSSQFDAINPQANQLTMASPDSFGFTRNQTGQITLMSQGLEFKPDTQVNFNSQSINIQQANIKGEGIQLQLYANGQLDQDLNINTLPDHSLSGELNIINSSIVISGNGTEQLQIRAGSTSVQNSSIFANIIGDSNHSELPAIDINVTDLLINNSAITSDVLAKGNAGSVTITSKGLLSVLNSGIIRSNTFASGDTGMVTVNAGELLIDAQGADLITGISSDVMPNAKGNANSVTVTSAGSLSVLNEGVISSSTEGFGNAGIVKIVANKVLVAGEDSEITSSVDSQSTGTSGTILLFAKELLSILDGAEVSSSSEGDGNAGSVFVESGNIFIDARGSNDFTGIASEVEVFSRGNAGNVSVTTPGSLSIINGGEISSRNEGTGNAGSVTISAATLLIDGARSSIASSADDKFSGNVGSIKITAKKITVSDQASINISSSSVSDQIDQDQLQQIAISAEEIALLKRGEISAASTGNVAASDIIIHAQSISLSGESLITTTANKGNGGKITFNTNEQIFLKNSQVTTSVEGVTGNGGDINITTPILIMDTGFIQANTTAFNASGGDINLNIDNLIPTGNTLITGGNKPLPFIPGLPGNNVIQAAAPDGVSGIITNTAPELNIASALAKIEEPSLNLNKVGQNPCSPSVRQNTLKRIGYGAIIIFKKGQNQQTLDHLIDLPSNSIHKFDKNINEPKVNYKLKKSSFPGSKNQDGCHKSEIPTSLKRDSIF